MGSQLKITHPNNYIVGALPGQGVVVPQQFGGLGIPGAGAPAADGNVYAPGFGPNADHQEQEFIQAALAAMASGVPPS